MLEDKVLLNPLILKGLYPTNKPIQKFESVQKMDSTLPNVKWYDIEVFSPNKGPMK